jgi:ArsR family transcriptional regulator
LQAFVRDAYIRTFEYNGVVNTSLPAFKAQIFQALANPTRIAIVEALRDGELSAGTLLTELGVAQANLSQHLAVLRAKQVVISRKSGNQVYYTLRDPVLVQVLDLLRQYFSAHLNDTLAMLGEMDSKPGRRV